MVPAGWINLLWSCSTALVFSDDRRLEAVLSPRLASLPAVRLEPGGGFKELLFPSCATLVIEVGNATEYEAAAAEVMETRSHIKMLVSTQSKAAFEAISTSRPHFDRVLVLNKASEGQLEVLREDSYSPFLGADRRAGSRRLSVAYTLLTPYVTSAQPAMSGMDPTLWKILESRLDLDVEFKLVDNFENMISTVRAGEADLCVSHASFVLSRYRGLDVGQALTHRRLALAAGHPGQVDSFYTITYPFSAGVWWATMGSVVAVGLVLSCLNFYYGEEFLSFKDVSISYVPLIMESLPHRWFSTTNKWSLLPVLYVWTLLAFLLAQAYKSNLLANLVKMDFEKPLDTFQQMLDWDMELYLSKGTVGVLLFKYSPIPIQRRVFERSLEEKGGYYDSITAPPHVIKRIFDGRAAGVGAADAFAGYNHLFRLSKESLSEGIAGYYYSIKLPLKREVETALSRMRDSGLLQHMRDSEEFTLALPERAYDRATPAPVKETVIEMSHFLPMLLSLCLGTGFGAAVFAAEAASGLRSFLSGIASTAVTPFAMELTERRFTFPRIKYDTAYARRTSRWNLLEFERRI